MDLYLYTIICTLIFLFFVHLFKKVFKKTPSLSTRQKTKIKCKILDMTPRQYEIFCANLFQMIGYNSVVTKESADGGKDIILTKFKKTYYVECKRFSKSIVGRPVAQKLVGALAGDKLPVKNGFIITSSRFSKGCLEYCDSVGVKCIDLNKTINLIESLPLKKRKQLI